MKTKIQNKDGSMEIADYKIENDEKANDPKRFLAILRFLYKKDATFEDIRIAICSNLHYTNHYLEILLEEQKVSWNGKKYTLTKYGKEFFEETL